MTKQKILVVLGPTASGKSNLAINLAKKFNGEIISADSRQIYRGLDIASNKISKSEMGGNPHHLLDIVNPDQDYTLYNWQGDAFATIGDIIKRNKLPIIAGGTGLYISSILQNYQLDSDPPQLSECPYNFLVIGLSPAREKLYDIINQRVDRMRDNGSIDEVKTVYRKFPDKNLPALSGIGYREIIEYLDNKSDLAAAIIKIKKNSRHYAKRQMTWFRRMERQDIKIHWNMNTYELNKRIKDFLSK